MKRAQPRVKRATRAEAAAATRRRILESARRLFLRDGFGATSLDRIAEEAGLTKGAIYGHFRNKAELFIALDEGGLGIGPALGSNPSPDLDWDALVRQMAHDLSSAKIDRRELSVYLETLAFALRDRAAARRAAASIDETVRANIEAFRLFPGAPEDFPRERFVTAGIGGVLGLVIIRQLAPDLIGTETFEDLLLGLSGRLQEGS